ncbi:phage holin family protein [Edaphovirga cremea]|uniref:phage holin family protein n=1 Tax=Edaphovirga cremea TaxID=2267246 RepID=UPI000DEECB11|nr:phage holin family protein [Edaphovirga cremea]
MAENNVLLLIDAMACAVMAMQLMVFQRGSLTYRPLASCFAWALIVASVAVPIRILSGEYLNTDWSETFINVALCIAVVRAQGNVMKIINPG